MSNYFDPNAEAHMWGRTEGRLAGRQEGEREGVRKGYEQGHSDGFNEGYMAGHNQGWNEALAQANAEMLKQMEFTRQHVLEKEALSQQIEQQRRLIEQLSQRLDEMERENANLKGSNESLRQVVTALKEANERLQAEVAQINNKFQKQSAEYTEQIWQLNRSVVFMNSVRSVLEELTIGNGSQAQQVRELFSRRYGEQVSKAIQEGVIRAPLDKDETFAKTLPRTQKFITDMLASVAQHAPLAVRESLLQQAEMNDHSHEP